jgi:cobalt-zinc-cadmium efflux system membrane fusion protein
MKTLEQPQRRRPLGLPLHLPGAVALLLAAALTACGDDATKAPAAAASAPDAAASAADANVVKAAPELAQRLKIAPASRAQVAEPLAVVGRLDFNEQSMARVGATVTGRVTELQAQPGQRVSAGTVLAQLHSTELGTAQLAYLKAKAQRELANQAAERAKLLLAADVIGSAEAQRRQSELQVADVEMRAAADQLRVMGMSAKALAATNQTGAITSVSSVVSTVDGVVVERNVNRGQVVQPADVMFTVADISRLWAVAQVPEAMAARVAPGQKVRIEIPSNGVEPIEAKLDWVADIVNPETRTVTVRAEIDNAKRKLRPAMLATMVIEPRAVDRLVVPAAAVVRENDADHVFLKIAENTFRLVPVKLGVETEDVRPVEDGLKGGEQIVVDGAFHLNNERNRAALGGS